MSKRDGRLPAIWLVLFLISIATRTYVAVSDEARHGHVIGIGWPLVDEITSHLVVAALLPALYWLHRRWPIGERYNLALHVAAVVPFSILHSGGMAALRLLWFSGIVHVPYSFPLTADRLQYEFAKDLVTYLMLTSGVVALNFLLQRKLAAPEAPPSPSADLRETVERFAVRKRGGSEVVVEVADIDWIGQLRHPACGRRDLRDPLLAGEARGRARPQTFRPRAQILDGQYHARGGSDAVGERRLAHPAAGRGRNQSEPALPPAFRGAGAGAKLSLNSWARAAALRRIS
jgi:hypothetical protein